MLKIAVVFIATAFFGVSHSVLASLSFKRKLASIIGNKIAFYRMFYNIFSTILFFSVLALIPKSRTIVYRVSPPFDLILFGLQVLAFLGLAWAGKSFDLWEFVGVSQIVRYLKGEYKIEDLDESPDFRISGAFKCCRHPVYFFSILFIGLRPEMDVTYLTLFIASTLYFIVGAYFEEKKLVKIYGDVYVEYKKNVPMLFPSIFVKKKKS